MSITASDVKALRDRTGAGMMDCKAALIEANGDVEEAITILRKKGMAQVAKKAGRTMKEGLVGVRLSPDARSGVIAEVNCESDFVARTNDFQTLVGTVTGDLLAAPAGTDPQALVAPEGPIGQKVAAAIAKLGENMAVSRAARLDGALIGSYLHLGGRIGVLVELSGVDGDAVRQSDAAQSLLRELAMQIAAASPAYATRAEIPADVIDKEKAVYRAQMEGSGKPAAVIDKIVDGKLGSFYQQVVLPDQASIRDQKMTVSQVIADAAKPLGGAVSVARFVRFKVGEGA